MSVSAPTPNKKLTYVSLTVFSFLLDVYVHCVLLMFLNTGISIGHGHAYCFSRVVVQVPRIYKRLVISRQLA